MRKEYRSDVHIKCTLFMILMLALYAVNGSAQQPTITSVSPLMGYPASAVTITGNNFNTTPANNIVYFGATRATVNTASATSLNVTVPTGATYMPVTVNNTASALTGFSQYPFLPTYDNSPYIPGIEYFQPKVDYTTGAAPLGVVIVDMDGDGKPDMVVANNNSMTISVYRNISTSGSITAGSFAPRVDYATASNDMNLAFADIDGDGKPDLAVINGTSVSIFRNTCSVGSISLSRVDIATGTGPDDVAIGDIDGDGKADLVITYGSYSTSVVSVFRNTSSVGSIGFAARVDFATGIGPRRVMISDIDGDGKGDLAVSISGAVSVYRNTSTIGSVNFAANVDFPVGGVYGLAMGDIDGDGKEDIAVTNYGTNTVSVLRNTSTIGSVNFAPNVDFATGAGAYVLALGDIDGDGKPDLAVTNHNDYTISVFLNTSVSGTINFSAKEDYAAGMWPDGIAIGDIDGDGYPDMVVTSSGSSTVSVIRNNPLSSLSTPITGSTTITMCSGSGTTTLSDATATGVWISSNTSVATVSAGGIVTGVGGGSTIISYIVVSAMATTTVTVTGQPIITTVSPMMGYPASAVTITGTGFSTTPANNIVYFGATRATVTSASATSLSVNVPTGATYMPVTVHYSGCPLTGFSQYSFLPTYDNSAYIPGSVSFDPKVDFTGGAYYVVIGDIDGDGKADLVAITGYNTVSVFRNTSSSGSITAGSFAPRVDFTTGNWAQAIAIGDIDGDGKPDLAVTNESDYTVSVLRNTSTIGSVTFASKVDFTTGTYPMGVAIGDIDGDGKADLVVANQSSNTVSVLHNISTAGTVNFAPKVDFATGSHPYGIAIGDIDGDGKPDVAVTNYYSSSTSVLRNTSTSGYVNFATRVDITTGLYPISIAIGDIDGDGKADLAVANVNSNTVSVIRNTSVSGSVTFASNVDFTTGTNPYEVAIGDIDGDGKPDLTIANYGSNTVSVFRNTSISGSITAGSFAAKVDFTTGANPYGVAIGDIDGDGKPDLAVTNRGSNTVSVLRNDPLAPITGVAAINTCSGGSGTTTLSNANAGGVWSSGNTSVAIVNTSGVVTAVAGGTAVISYTILSGSATTTVTVTGGLPVITSVSPLIGYPASAVTITGTGFNTTPANNIVFFGATQATVTAASTTSLSVNVPTGATYQYVTVDNTGCALTGFSLFPFLPTYNNAPYIPGMVNFDPKVDFVTGTFPDAIAIGDIDGDGKPDLAVTNYSSNTVSVYRNTSTSGSITAGSFAAKVDFITGSSPVCVVIGDIDGDGKPDLVVTNAGPNTVSVFRNTSVSGSVNFAAKVDFATGSFPYRLAIGDIDGDGKPDLVVVNRNSNTVSVFLSTSMSGSVTFAAKVDFITGTSPSSVAIGDIDGDGKPDLAVTNSNSNSVSVLLNTSIIGSVTLAAKVDFATGLTPDFGTIGDIDGDGKQDLVVCNYSINTVSVIRNTSVLGVISFDPKVDFTSGTSPFYVAIGDLDGDGKPDLAVANEFSNNVSVLRNISVPGSITAGAFAAKVDFNTGVNPCCVAIGDIDGDGKPDLAVTNYSSNTASILHNDPLSPISGVTTINMCSGGSTTTLSDMATNGVWSTPNTTVATVDVGGVVYGVSGGTAVISYTVMGGTATTTVTVNAPSPASISGANTVCVGSTITLSDATPAGTWSSSNSAVATINSAGFVVWGALQGTTTITYSTGCGSPATQVITVNAAPVPIAGTPVTLCVSGGTTTTTLSDGSTGGTWSSSNSTVATINSAGFVVTSASQGITTITYNNGCGSPATQVITVNAAPVPIAGTPVTLCLSGGTTTTTLSDASTGGTWSSSNSTVATINSAGFVVTSASQGITTISYANGCGTATQVVTVNAVPAAIAGNSTICFGGGTTTTTLSDASTGGTWSSSNSTVGTINSAGYVVTSGAQGATTISYANGCGVATTKIITVNAVPAAIAGNSTICFGGGTTTTTLSDASTGGTWSSGNSAVATINSAGFVLTSASQGTTIISYSNGCGAAATITATVNATPAAITGNAQMCLSGVTITLSDASTNGTWSTSNSTVATINSGTRVMTPGALQGITTISYSNGCGAAASITATVNATPAAIGGNAAMCAGGSTINLTNTSTNGTWSGGTAGIATVGSTTGLVTSGATQGTTTINYSNGCGTASITATVNATSAAISGNSTICFGGGTTTTTLSDASTGGIWSSSNSAVATINSAGFVVTSASQGTTTITYANGCGTATQVITVNAVPAVIAGNSPICFGGGTTTTTLSDASTGGTWSSSNSGVATINSAGFVVTSASQGITTITYNNGCGVPATKIVTVNAVPVAIAGNSTICFGGGTTTTTLSDVSTGGTWSSSNSTVATINSAGFVLTSASQGITTITYNNGCGIAATMTATVNATPAAIAGAPTTLCVSGGTTTTALSDASTGGTWSSSNSAVATINSAGYMVTSASQGITTISYANGCGVPATKIVTVNAVPVAIAGNSTICFGGGTTTATLSDGSTGGTWSSSNSTVATINSAGFVLTSASQGTTTITYDNGCGSAATITATVNATPAAITGNAQMCTGGSTITLSDASTNGTWSSSNSLVATVDAVTGLVTPGGIQGTATITYSNGCGAASITASVNATPVAIDGNSTICFGGGATTTTLSDASTGGTWSSSNTAIATINNGGFVVTSASQGTTTITYNNGCGSPVTKVVTVNNVPVAIAGSMIICSTLTTTLSDWSTGGAWSSSNTSVATVDPATGLVTPGAAGTTTITYSNGCGANTTAVMTIQSPLAPPATINGAAVFCQGTTNAFSDATPGGVWSSSNSSVATVTPSGIVTGAGGGTATISYTISNVCGSVSATTTVTVNPLPATAAITGYTTSFCFGTMLALSDATPGGVWSSNITSVATISSTGVVTGVAGGSSTIFYSVTNGCGTVPVSVIITVDPYAVIGPIAGNTNMCIGSVVSLSDATSGGVWSSGAAGIATVSNTGVVTGIAAGSATISYSISNSCGSWASTAIATVNTIPSPGTITGLDSVCTGHNVALSDNVTGGVWSSDYLAIAMVTGAGVVHGLAAGFDTIRYTVTNNCGSANARKVITVLSSSSPACWQTSVNAVVTAFAELKVFPNPNDGTFSIEMRSDINEPVQIIITNVVGEKVKEFITTTNQSREIRLSATGIYLISAITSEGIYNSKVVISTQ